MQIDLVGVLEQHGPLAMGVPQDSHQTLRVPRGADVAIALMVLDESGAPVDLTSLAVVLTVRRHSDAEDSVIKKTALTASREGIAEFELMPSDTKRLDPGRYVFDVWVGDEPAVPLSPFLLEPSTHH